MQYTLWSKGRVVGHADLGFRESTPGVRFGWFHPTDAGQEIVDVITSPSRVLLESAKRRERGGMEAELDVAARDVAALELELLAEDGSIVRSEEIGITDTEITRQFAEVAQVNEIIEALTSDTPIPAEEEELEEDDVDLMEFSIEMDDELEPLPRYQIIVFLEGYEALMDAEAAALGIE